MADRVVSVRVKLEVDQANRDAKQFSGTLLGVASSADRAGRSGAQMGKLASAAKGAGLAVASVGGLAVGGMALLTGSVTKGGIAYNTLEQTSRAALKTVLGSASAATGQMEALREFGKTSPFPRQVWIQAQQQLLAFGMSAEKIIPTFEAVQDAVAAAGGGGQQISEVVEILAKVQSTGKVTAETLNELGYRGIDAATLIGNAMGKTAAEVREDISSQAISGVDFIDQLTAAMSTRFAGAAEGVKQTWEGAKDRIKGAVRDIGSVLATPLVDPEGGGAMVDWANAVADALRALEARLIPVMDALEQRAAPVVDAFTRKLEDLAEWIRTADFSKIGEQIQGMLPAIAGITAGFGVMGAKSLPVIGGMVSGLKPLPVALAAAALASPELRSALLDLLAAAAPLIQAGGEAATVFAGLLGPAFTLVAALLQPVIAIVQFLGNVIGSLPGPVQALVASLALLGGLGLAGKLSGIVGAFQSFGSEMQAQRRFAEMAGQQVGTLGSAYSVAASKVSGAAMGIRGAMAGAAGFLAGPWGAAIGLGVSVLGAFAMAQNDAANATAGFNYEIDAQTGKLSAASIADLYEHLATGAKVAGESSAYVKDVIGDLGLTIDDLVGYLLKEEDAQRRVNAAIAEGGPEGQVLLQFLKRQQGEISRQVKVQNEAADSGSKYAGVNDEVAGSANGAASAASGMAGAISASGAAATDASARLQQLKADLQLTYDAQFGLAEAQDKFQSGMHGLRSLFERNDKAVTKSAGSQDKYNDSLKRQAKIVRDAREQLEDLAEAQRKAEQEAREAAAAAKQRQLDELFGRQFDVSSTVDAFRSSLAQAGADVKEARKDKTAGATALTGFTEGALANRDRLRNLVQQAQAVIQAEIERGASKGRIQAVTQGLTGQLAAQAKSWGLNAKEVQTYTRAISQFGGLANREVRPNLAAVRKEYAEQRREIQANTREQLESARASATTASASSGATAATKVHTAALRGNSESAIENREKFRQQVKAAQEELTQMHLNGASKQQLTKRGEELARQLEREARQLGFNKRDVQVYSDAVRASAVVVRNYPPLKIRTLTAGALQTLKNFQKGVDRQMGKIKKNYELGITTRIGTTSGGHHIAGLASGGFVSGPGGPREDKIPAMLSDGEFVVNARDTKRVRPLLEAINTGLDPTGFAAGGLVSLKVKTMLEGGMGRALQAMRRLMEGSFFMPSVAGGAAGSGGAGVQRWAPLVLEALRLLRQPAWLLPKVLRRMNQESGGNPRAINLWDSNAARGTPSIGLMQTIGPTFAAYAGPFRSRGIYDPFANIFAGLNYAINRYGSLAYAMDKPGGYASGGLVKGGDGANLAMGQHFAEFMRGSYRNGTDYVPMDGMYQLHRGERVTPAGQNGPVQVVMEVRGDGSRAADFVVHSVQKAHSTGQLTLTVKR